MRRLNLGGALRACLILGIVWATFGFAFACSPGSVVSRSQKPFKFPDADSRLPKRMPQKTPDSQQNPGTGVGSSGNSGTGTDSGGGSGNGGNGGSRGAACGDGSPAPCTDCDFIPTPTGVNGGASSGSESGVNCSGSNVQQKSQTITFEDPYALLKRSCDWAIDGNLPAQNRLVTARREQRKQVDLPPNAVLCSLSIDFQKQKNIKYDDHMLFAIDNSVLMITRDYTSSLVKAPNGLFVYDWEKLKGIARDGLTGCNNGPECHSPYCIGGPDSCQIPLTQEPGDFRLTVDPNLVQGALACSATPNREFLWVTFGDDDDGSNGYLDCSHSDITFTANYRYVVQ